MIFGIAMHRLHFLGGLLLCGSALEAPSTCSYSSPLIREGPRDARELGEPGDLEGPVTLQRNAEFSQVTPLPPTPAHSPPVALHSSEARAGCRGAQRAYLASE